MRRKTGRLCVRATVAGVTGSLAIMLFGVGAANSSTPQDPYQQQVDQLASELAALPQTWVDEAGQVVDGTGVVELDEWAAAAPAAASETSAATRAAGYIVGPMVGGGTMLGEGYAWYFPIGGSPSHWLGAFDVSGKAQWCIDFSALAPEGATSSVKPTLKTIPDAVAGSSDFQVLSNEQMGFVLAKYGPQTDAGIRAATSVLGHLNFELGGGRPYLDDLLETLSDASSTGPAGPIIASMARTMAADARANTPAYVASPSRFVVEEGQQNFELVDVGVKDKQSGKWRAGVSVTVELTGPGVFDATGVPGGSLSPDGRKWSGMTVAGPLSLTGSSTGNGLVRAQITFGPIEVPAGLTGAERPNGTQTTIYEAPDVTVPMSPEPPETTLLRNFQPKLVSSTEAAGSRIVEAGTTTIADELTVFADPNYKNPQWLGVGKTVPGQDGYQPLPVKFKGTAYFTGERPAAEATAVPKDAKAVASAEFTANGPGKHTVKAQYAGDPGFITWVWVMNISDQKQIAEADRHMLAANWSDNFGVAAEYTSVRWPGKVESNLNVKPTIDNTYLVDDVWISGLPDDHPNFAGSHGFGADRKTVEQQLFFWPEGTDIKSLDDATQIGKTLTIPAKNGMYLGQGDLSWKLQRDETGKPIRGTYQAVHTFKGDDRALPFQSEIPDETEQFTVTGNPQIGTTATGPDGKKVIEATKTAQIKDKVCYLELLPGKEYVLSGVLMNQQTGKPLLARGKEVTAKKVFTPDDSDGCVEVLFEFDASALHGSTIVVFEELWQGEVLVTSHADIGDIGQTVKVEPKPEEPEKELPKTGAAGLVPLALGSLALVGGAALFISTRKALR